ncbi:MAG: tripartite tricarboxylate transporter substrate binding protein [Burkholderiales bacterium]|nr:tripartite tricarboxylate transporter substrate binding protein [Burkholderiales bacterium]
MKTIRFGGLVKRMGSAALAVALVLVAGASAAVAQQAYPSRQITVVVPQPAGGPADSVARLFAGKLREVLNAPIVVENRAGASGMIGAAHVAAAAPDGYTLYVNASIHAINPLLYRERMKFDSVKDFTAISLIAQGELVFTVNPQVPATTIAEFIARAKAAPAQISFANTGVGSGGHIATVQFFHEARLENIPLVPYKGTAPAVQDVVGGQVSAVVVPTITAVPLVKAGRLRALAVTGRERSKLLPEVPTMIEVGMKNFEFNTWYGFWGPARLPPAVLKTLESAAAKVMDMPEVKATLLQAGFESSFRNSVDFAAFIENDMARNRKVIDAARMTAD